MDGSNMTQPTRWDRALVGVRWLKNSFAEWFIGSWALILGWFIVSIIFFNFLLMDGYFSRGLGEGSGVNPDRFQQVGWMYRCFAALFLVLAVKLEDMKLKWSAVAVKALGLAVTLLVVLHATGFGLKALDGKRSSAAAVEIVHDTTVKTNDELIAELKGQKAGIEATRDKQLANLQSSIDKITGDGLDNDEQADPYRADQSEERRLAREQIATIDGKITDLTTSGGKAEVQGEKDIAEAEDFAPLFVGLAMLTTWSWEPAPNIIWVAGVSFIIFWVLVGDWIAIVMPPTLYKIHLRDAKNRKVNLSADAFADLQAQADELTKRKANLGEGAEKALNTKKRKRNRAVSMQMLEDQRAESVKREAAVQQEINEAIAEMQSEPVEDDVPDLLNPEEPDEQPDDPETPAAPAVEEVNADEPDDNASESGAEKPDEDGRRAEAA